MKKRKVIFLDIDGVLNRARTWAAGKIGMVHHGDEGEGKETMGWGNHRLNHLPEHDLVSPWRRMVNETDADRTNHITAGNNNPSGAPLSFHRTIF